MWEILSYFAYLLKPEQNHEIVQPKSNPNKLGSDSCHRCARLVHCGSSASWHVSAVMERPFCMFWSLSGSLMVLHVDFWWLFDDFWTVVPGHYINLHNTCGVMFQMLVSSWGIALQLSTCAMDLGPSARHRSLMLRRPLSCRSPQDSQRLSTKPNCMLISLMMFNEFNDWVPKQMVQWFYRQKYWDLNQSFDISCRSFQFGSSKASCYWLLFQRQSGWLVLGMNHWVKCQQSFTPGKERIVAESSILMCFLLNMLSPIMQWNKT